MTIFIILFSVLFLVLIFQVIKLLFLAIKKKELSKEVKKTLIVFLCSLFAFILVGMTVPESTKNAIKKEEELNKKAKEAKEAKKKAEKEKKQAESAKKKENNCVLGIFCEEETNKEENKKEIKYEILRESSDINKVGSKIRNIYVLIPSCDISKNDMYKMLIPKLSVYAKGYDSLWLTFYCDRRFYEIYDGSTNGSIKLRGDGTISVDALRFHKTNELMSDKEVSIYMEYQKLKGKSKDSTEEERKKFEEEKRNILKKYNITENELIEIDLKGFSFTL